VTRAKKRVIFFDEDEAKRAPFFELLERAQVANKMSLDARQQVRVCVCVCVHVVGL